MGLLCTVTSLTVATVAICAYLKASTDLKIERALKQDLEESLKHEAEMYMFRESKLDSRIQDLNDEIRTLHREKLSIRFSGIAGEVPQELLAITGNTARKPNLTVIK